MHARDVLLTLLGVLAMAALMFFVGGLAVAGAGEAFLFPLRVAELTLEGDQP